MKQMQAQKPVRSAAPRTDFTGVGARPDGDGTIFRVWAPKARTVEVIVERPGGEPLSVSLRKGPDGHHSASVPGVGPGDLYRYRVDGRGPFPDPASRYQPEGVHGPSEVVDPFRFAWTDQDWRGVDPRAMVVYELHVGTFSPEGTFAGVTSRLEALCDLGVNAIELMPVADFPGDRNWGYDGVNLFAPSRAYGTPDDLRELVDRAHRLGLAVLLDVVYNHFGPSGNYTGEFSDQYMSVKSSSWGTCMNLDGEGSEHVAAFFIENALHWLHEYHFDGLRLDATHALHDASPRHFLEVLTERVHAAFPDRRPPLIAEDHRNLAKMLRPRQAEGWGLDGVWADDFHHQMRRLLAGDSEGYYKDFSGTTEDLAATINQGWFFTGQHSEYLDEPRGTDPAGVEPHQFVVCLQNHDQVGNRAFGDRLHHSIDPAAYRAATALLLGLPQTPMLFMGQEWSCSSPFRFFTHHDEELGRLVTEGRRKEFRHFEAFVHPEIRETIPDPQSETTFETSKLEWSEKEREPHASVYRLHQQLLRLRRTEPALAASGGQSHNAEAVDDSTLLLSRQSPGADRLLLVVRLKGTGTVDLAGRAAAAPPEGFRWRCILTTEDPAFAPDAAAPEIDLESPVPSIRFPRPATIILKAVPDDQVHHA